MKERYMEALKELERFTEAANDLENMAVSKLTYGEGQKEIESIINWEAVVRARHKLEKLIAEA